MTIKSKIIDGMESVAFLGVAGVYVHPITACLALGIRKGVISLTNLSQAKQQLASKMLKIALKVALYSTLAAVVGVAFLGISASSALTIALFSALLVKNIALSLPFTTLALSILGINASLSVYSLVQEL